MARPGAANWRPGSPIIPNPFPEGSTVQSTGGATGRGKPLPQEWGVETIDSRKEMAACPGQGWWDLGYCGNAEAVKKLLSEMPAAPTDKPAVSTGKPAVPTDEPAAEPTDKK